MDGVLILAGPTAVGKTALALDLAERFGAEIVGADARQIYRDMPIGTAAPTDQQRARVPHHLVAFLDPRERYSAARYVDDALNAIDDIAARGKRAIVVGGTGFYIRALCGDVALSRSHDPTTRARLAREARVHPPEVLHAWLAARDPGRAAVLAPSDRYRVIRALEIALLGRPRQRPAETHNLRTLGMPFVKVFADVDDTMLDARIAARVDAMLRGGLIDEAERIGADAVASDAVGYPQALAFLGGWSTPNELRTLLERETRRYAKRQRTWFRSEPNVVRIGASDAAGPLAAIARDALGWT